MNDTFEPTDDEISRNTREIEIESARIQREIMQERRAKMTPSPVPAKPHSSPSRSCPVKSRTSPNPSPNRLPAAERSLMRTQLKCSPPRHKTQTTPLKSSTPRYKPTAQGFNDEKIADVKFVNMSKVSQDKQTLQRELVKLQESIKCSHGDLLHMSGLIAENRVKLEDARSQVSITETKRDAALRELEKITQELNIKRKKVKSFDTDIKTKMEEIRLAEEQIVDKQRIKAVVQERDQLLIECQSLSGIQLERDELVRQLEACKDDLFREQKLSRSKSDEMQEEIEVWRMKKDEVMSERDAMYKKVIDMESRICELEQQNNNLVHEQEGTVREVRERVMKENYEMVQQSTRELDERQRQLQDITNKLDIYQKELEKKDQVVMQLRNQCIELKNTLTQEHDVHERAEDEHAKTMQNLRREMDEAMVQLKEQCFLEKQKSLESLREQLEEEKREGLYKEEQHMMRQLAELENKLISRENHIQKLEDNLASHSDEIKDLAEKLKEENKEEIREVMIKEREAMNQEREFLIRREREVVMAEMVRKQSTIIEDADRKDKALAELRESLDAAKHEVEEQKQMNRHAIQERLVAVAKAKDIVRQEKQVELDKTKDKLVQDHKKELGKVREKVSSLETEVKKLRQDKLSACQKEKQQTTALDRTQRTLVHEINEECRRTASVLGLNPRRVSLAASRVDRSSSLSKPPSASASRSPTTQALANLRACTEELRNHVVELNQEIEAQKTVISRLQKDKDESLESLTRQMEREKTHELETLKERLIKDHMEEIKKVRTSNANVKDNRLEMLMREKNEEMREIQRGIHTWKEETAEKFAQKFQQEMSREIEKRQSKQMGLQRELEQTNALQQREIERLEKQFKHLASEMCGSMDVSNGDYRRTTDIKSTNVTDINKLETNLNTQGTELRQLERAYNDLQNQYNSTHLPSTRGRRSLSPATNRRSPSSSHAVKRTLSSVR